MNDPATRLELALEAFLAFQRQGGSRAELLARHPEYADLLEAMIEVEGEPARPEGASTFGDFELLREVGRGGVGVVHEARKRNLDRRVALKVLHAPFASDPMVLARFRREANTLARLDHTGIVRVLDVGETSGRPWLAMEFVEGESLAARLEQLKAQGAHRGDSLRQLLEIVAQVADALHHAHEAGIVHRDVKPNNILLREDGRAVLGDFGLAREASDLSLTRTGSAAGTPYYMSPEQILARSSECDGRSDVFSLGATLYECITLQRPFDGPTAEVVLHQILTRDPRDPRKYQSRLSADLAAIVLKALEKERERRYPTMRAFAEDLRAFLELRPVQARPPSRSRRLWRWIRREPLRATAVAVLLVAAGFGTWFVLRLPDLRAGELARMEQEYEAVMARGFQARINKDREGSFTAFGRALELFPRRSEALAMWCMAARVFDGPKAAWQQFEQRVPPDDPDPDLAWLKALLLRRLDRLDEARALEQQFGEPRSATALWLAGVQHAEGEQPTQAQKRRALDLVSLAARVAPSPRILLHLQWSAWASVADDAAARRECAQALLRLWPDDPLVLHYAAANVQTEDPARAAALQARAIGLGLKDHYAHRNLAYYLFQADKHPDWIAPMRKQLELHPEDQTRAQLVNWLLRKDEAGLARAEAEQWLQQAPDHPDALRALGQLLVDDDGPRALELMRKAAAQRPQDADCQYDLCVILHALNTPEFDVECRRHLVRVLELDPTHARAHARLLDVLDHTGTPGEVLAEMERWLQAKPDDAAGWQALARLLMARGAGSLPLALMASERADELHQGKDAAVLELKARILDALDCGAAANACRERARALGK